MQEKSNVRDFFSWSPFQCLKLIVYLLVFFVEFTASGPWVLEEVDVVHE